MLTARNKKKSELECSANVAQEISQFFPRQKSKKLIPMLQENAFSS